MESKNIGDFLKSSLFHQKNPLESTFFRQPYDARQQQLDSLYGLRSNISPPQNPALTSFENDIYEMVRNIEFRKVRNYFLDKLKEDINETRSPENLFVFVDKSANLYQMSDTDYKRPLGNNITSNYRKFENGVKHKIDKETKKKAGPLDLSKKMECCPTFIIIKDHKPNFRNNTKCRLINPAKNESGLVSKKHPEKIIAHVANTIKVNQW